MMDLLLIILFSVNGVQNIETDFYAQQGEFKYVVSIRLSKAHLCTGTIIDETHILTIAHMFIDTRVSQLSVVAGIAMVMHPFFDSFPVQKIFPHPAFVLSSNPGEPFDDHWANDIAILRLTERFHWNSDYAPVPFMKSELNWSSCSDCVMISWKYAQDYSRGTVTQMWNFVYAVSEEECLKSGIHVLERETCFVDLLRNSLITSSKLGSPIVCDGVMIGFAVKVTENRAPGTPSTFLNVLAHSGFIKAVQTNAQTAVRPGQYPYVVSIWNGHYHSCGGFILDETHILTAGHCVRKSKKYNLKVASGYPETSYLSPATKWSSVLDIVYHSEDRAKGHLSHDIAILVLAEPFILGKAVNSLQYEKLGDVCSQLLCQSFHWRRTINKDGKITVKLTTTNIRKLDKERCKKMSVFVSEREFCAGNPYYMYTVDSGDVGNPVIRDGRPIGFMVKAFSMNNHPPPVAVFLQLHAYEEFIRSAIRRS